MTISDEELMAFADGELTGSDADRVAAAVAADPTLSARIEDERRLRTMLKGDLDPVMNEPVPENLTLLIADAAADEAERDMTDAPVAQPAQVLDMAAARARRAAKDKAQNRPAQPWPNQWRTGAAIAASLVLGVLLGAQVSGRGNVAEVDGQLVASGSLARSLEGRLASSEGSDLRILASFQRGGDYCRVYDGGASAGIACKEQDQWVLERTVPGSKAATGQYRQAGSPLADLMANAQDMAGGDPLDAQQERDARARGWTK